MTNRVLLTGAGGPAAISFYNAAQQGGFDFYMGDIDHCAAGLYLVPRAKRVKLSRGDSEGFVEHLLSVCRKHEIDVLVPTVDCELLPIARAADRFEALGVKVLIAKKRTLELCLDKNMLFEVCKNFVPVPRSSVLTEELDLSEWKYPLFVKPRRGSGSVGIAKIETPADLESIDQNGEFLVQEYLPGEEYSVDVLANKSGRVLAAVPRERMKVDSGIAVASRSVKNTRLQTLAKVVALRIGLRYAANIQFKISKDGEPCLLEVNPRFPGTMALTVASGVNMPIHTLKDILGLENFHSEFNWDEKVMVRTWQEHYVVMEELEELASERLERGLEEVVLMSAGTVADDLVA